MPLENEKAAVLNFPFFQSSILVFVRKFSICHVEQGTHLKTQSKLEDTSMAISENVPTHLVIRDQPWVGKKRTLQRATYAFGLGEASFRRQEVAHPEDFYHAAFRLAHF